MRISRLCYLAAAAALAGALVAPATASALLTNSYGQQFAGTAVCESCHDSGSAVDYSATSHGLFSPAIVDPADSTTQGAGMWPAGRIEGGQSLAATEVVFTLGAGTGEREYLADGNLVLGSVPATWGPIVMANGISWDPDEPFDFEYNLNSDNEASNGITFGAYTCSQCHQLGVTRFNVKPAAGNFSGASPAPVNSWATPTGSDPNLAASYIPGSSIQCEKCHGTGLPAGSDTPGGHWSSGVEIVGYNTTQTTNFAKAGSFKLLDSQVCGQCHATFKAGNIVGFTPDATITDFVTPYALSDVPATSTFNIATSKFFPNSVSGLGQSAAKLGGQSNLHHSYYTEWALSGHSWRGALTSISPNATPYQKVTNKHFTMSTGGPDQVLCDRCHTGEGYLKRKLAVDTPTGFNDIMASDPETPSVQGQLGQECADCHIAHGAQNLAGTNAATNNADAEARNVEVGMGVRPPEKANGPYSTHGLSTDNASICEDCHNWETEVLANGGPITAPTLPAILGKYVSHPQREIYHGRTMLEIPAAGVFMSSKDGSEIAKCQECHMPATYSDKGASTALDRYSDRSAKRYSHRMFIMMPGDAKAWGLAPWGDSCSPCHAGETQTSLQSDINTWQTTANALATQTINAISAAVTRGDNVTNGDIDLLKRASANLSLYQQDGSFGVHNPEYEQAGLTKAVALAKSAGGSLTVSAPNSVGANQLFAVAGRALNGDGSPAAGVTIVLSTGGSTVTDANGNYAFAWAMTATRTFTATWHRSSQSLSDLTASVNTQVEKVLTSVSLSRSASSVLHGHTFTLSGELHPDMRASVTIQYRKPGSSVWHTLVTRTTNLDGEFSYKFHTSTRGLWRFRSHFSGSATFLGDYSPTVTVRIR